VFPDNYSDLLKLKGVGEYTAAAIALFSYNEVVPVVDGNVSVLSRYFDVETDIVASAKRVCSTGFRIDKRQSCY
jgi:A/G-specific adenine glycosylase